MLSLQYEYTSTNRTSFADSRSCLCLRQVDYGTPCKLSALSGKCESAATSTTALCKETGKGSLVFVREYTKATVRHDCNTGKSTISPK